MGMRKLSELEGNDILDRTTLDEVPEGYRDEVWVEEENGEIINNWFVGDDGAVSYSGTVLTPAEFSKKFEAEQEV